MIYVYLALMVIVFCGGVFMAYTGQLAFSKEENLSIFEKKVLKISNSKLFEMGNFIVTPVKVVGAVMILVALFVSVSTLINWIYSN